MKTASETISIAEIIDPALAATLADLGAEIFTKTFGHLYKPEDIRTFLTEKHSVETYRDLIVDNQSAVWLARDAAGEAIGYAVAGPCHLPAPDMPDNSGELSRLYVSEAARGAGLGQRMLAHVFAWLDARYDPIYLSVYSQNHGAQRLYKRYGFEKVHDYFFMVGNHADPEFIMKRMPQSTGGQA
jgi:diamine N-acetyltransferase